MEPSLDIGAGLGRAALVGGEGTVASERPLGFHDFGLRLMGEDLEQGGRAGEQGGAEGRGLSGGAGITFPAAEVSIRIHVRGVEVSWIQMVSPIAAFPLSLGVRGGDGTGVLAVEE